MNVYRAAVCRPGLMNLFWKFDGHWDYGLKVISIYQFHYIPLLASSSKATPNIFYI